MSRAVAILALLAPLPWLTGCAGGRGADAPEPLPIELGRPASVGRGLLSRQCEPVADPGSMPSFAALVRPGTRAGLSLATADFAPADSLVLSVRYDEEGRLVWVRSIGASITAERTESIQSLIVHALPEDGPGDWGFRVRIAAGDAIEVSSSVVCHAEVRQGVRRPVYPPRTISSRVAADRLEGLPVDLEITVDEQGRVLHVRLPRSTGDRGLDEYLIEWVMELDFFPKTHDGLPVAATITRSIRLPRSR